MRKTIAKMYTSLELCMKLYKLSGWNDTYFGWSSPNKQSVFVGTLPEDFAQKIYPLITPAYDLGYLLRKLPQNSWVGYIDTSGQRGHALAYTYAWNEKGTDTSKIAECRADTPEDAAATLTIELLKQGILRGMKQEAI